MRAHAGDVRALPRGRTVGGWGIVSRLFDGADVIEVLADEAAVAMLELSLKKW